MVNFFQHVWEPHFPLLHGLDDVTHALLNDLRNVTFTFDTSTRIIKEITVNSDTNFMPPAQQDVNNVATVDKQEESVSHFFQRDWWWSSALWCGWKSWKWWKRWKKYTRVERNEEKEAENVRPYQTVSFILAIVMFCWKPVATIEQYTLALSLCSERLYMIIVQTKLGNCQFMLRVH